MNTATKAERRKDPRLPGTDKVRLEWTDTSSQSKWVLGNCVDISTRGMRVEINDLVPENQYVRFELAKQNFRGSATVRNAKTKGRRSLIGLEFACSARWAGETAAAAPRPKYT
jgi:PilZ domain